MHTNIKEIHIVAGNITNKAISILSPSCAADLEYNVPRALKEVTTTVGPLSITKRNAGIVRRSEVPTRLRIDRTGLIPFSFKEQIWRKLFTKL